MKQIVVIEDDKKFRLNMVLDLEDAGYQVRACGSAEEGQALLQDSAPELPDLLLLDIRMPGKSGLDLLEVLSEAGILPPTIVISGEASISETVAALGFGVHDLLEKPFSSQRLMQSIRNCLSFFDLQRQVHQLRENQAQDNLMLGDSPNMQALRSKLLKIAPSSGRVLIMGESGTGKELVANFLHRYSKRAGGPFVKINCASLPSTLIEDELFGHVRGAYTGAASDKPGLFEDAHKGTLLLDEIGDMDLELQTRLLRVLEDGVVRRVGGRREIHVDVRVLAATNKDLPKRVGDGSFREDLYFRLNTLPITVPPLRERGQDIALLAGFFIAHFCQMNQTRNKTLTPQALEILENYSWPGNVRELRNLCERLAILAGEPIKTLDLPSNFHSRQPSGAEFGLIRPTPFHQSLSLKVFKAQCEKEFIENTLKRYNWDYVETAKALDIQRTYLHRKISQLEISKPDRDGKELLETVS